MSDNNTKKVYALDTDWLITAMTNYPPDLVPEFWEHLKKLIQENRMIICDPVYQEILYQEDDLSEWLKENINGALFYPSDEVLSFVKDKIMSVYEEKFSKWFDLDSPDGLLADPFLVATASVKGAVVVTNENKVIMQSNTPISKIPNACEEFGIDCICNNNKDHKQSAIVDFLRDTGYRQSSDVKKIEITKVQSPIVK